MEKTIILGKNFIKIEQEGKSGTISSNLKQTCPYCNQTDCNYSCDESQAEGFNSQNLETKEQHNTRLRFNASVDAIESLVLAHSLAGIDVESKEYIEGLETTLDALMNQI